MSDRPEHSAAGSEHIVIQDYPASPDPSPPSSPVDSPRKKNRAPSPPMSPSKLKCEAARYIPLQDHQFECPECLLPSSPTLNGHFELGMHGEVWPRRQLPASLSTPHRRRRPAPSPQQSRPRPRKRRAAPFPPISRPDAIPSYGSAFRTIPSATRPRNLFQDFMATLPRPFPIPAATGTPSPVSSPSSASTRSALSLSLSSAASSPPPRTPSSDVMLELYRHTRHPLDLRTHLTILPSWGLKANRERRR